MPLYKALIDTQEHVESLFADGNERPYHNLAHTQQVVDHCEAMCAHYHLDEEETFAVMAAAWFHDVGYLTGNSDGHEERSSRTADTFLAGLNVDELVREQVSACILATRMPQRPDGLPEQIICDADLSNLGSPEFRRHSLALRKEVKQESGKKIKKKDWLRESLHLLREHEYFTQYCRTRLGPQKANNAENLEAELAPPPETDQAGNTLPSPPTKKKKKKSKKKKSKKTRVPRSAETMFRTTAKSHVHLSEMADSKANILISINGILISFLVSFGVAQLRNNERLLIPLALFLLSAVLTIVLAILATRPKVTEGKFTRESLLSGKVNLLFFGSYHRMLLKDYDWGIRELIKDINLLHGNLIMDIYFQGLVLARKYALLRKAYTVFMVGIVVSALAFLVVLLIDF